MAEEENMWLNSPTNASKIHLHVERFSLKINWRLTERLLHSLAIGRIHTEVGRRGEEGPALLGSDKKEEGKGITEGQRASGGVCGGCIYTPSGSALGSDSRRTRSLCYFANLWA